MHLDSPTQTLSSKPSLPLFPSIHHWSHLPCMRQNKSHSSPHNHGCINAGHNHLMPTNALEDAQSGIHHQKLQDRSCTSSWKHGWSSPPTHLHCSLYQEWYQPSGMDCLTILWSCPTFNPTLCLLHHHLFFQFPLLSSTFHHSTEHSSLPTDWTNLPCHSISAGTSNKLNTCAGCHQGHSINKTILTCAFATTGFSIGSSGQH